MIGMRLAAADDALFLHGLLEGIACIESQSYELLQQLGATPVSKVTSQPQQIKALPFLVTASKRQHACLQPLA